MRLSALLLLLTSACAASAHPWGGLVVDASGNVYFTFVCPPVSENHVACVWRLAPGATEPTEVLISTGNPSDLVLARDANRVIYAAERVGSHPFRTRLWRFDRTGTPEEILPFQGPSTFNADPYAVGVDSTIYFNHAGTIWSRKDGAAPERVADAPDRRLTNLGVLSSGALVLQYGGDLIVGGQRTAHSLKEDDPSGLPFSGANILFDMAVAADATYLAYYGNREVLKVGPDGGVSTILRAEVPWSPSGVDQFQGTVYVLESVTPIPFWQFWKDRSLRPRIRAVRPDGQVRTLWEYTL